MARLADLAAPTLDTISIPAALQRPGDQPKTQAPPVIKEEVKAEPEIKEEIQEEIVPETKLETQAEVQVDPWEPLKTRFKDREPNEVLNEWETLQRERDELRTKAEEREIAARELQEKLISYDARHDPDFIKNAVQPIQEAKAFLMEICLEDQKLAEEAYALQRNKDLEPKERVAKLKALLEENGVTHSDWINAYKKLDRAVSEAGAYEANYKEIRAKRDQERLVGQEMEAKQRQDMLRQVHRTATFKVENEMKAMGIDFIAGYEDARGDHMLSLEKALSGAGYDQEQEVKNNLLGRLFLKNAKEIQASLKELAELKAAARSKPSDTPKETKKPTGVTGETKGIENKIWGGR